MARYVSHNQRVYFTELDDGKIFNRKTLLYLMVKTHGFPVKIFPTKPIHWIIRGWPYIYGKTRSIWWSKPMGFRWRFSQQNQSIEESDSTMWIRESHHASTMHPFCPCLCEECFLRPLGHLRRHHRTHDEANGLRPRCWTALCGLSGTIRHLSACGNPGGTVRNATFPLFWPNIKGKYRKYSVEKCPLKRCRYQWYRRS